ncbi:GASA domain-containing protein [Cephalotus follicularis]|uniref:GASA domain-containing protein n=1 Tax=Cephalotus follicularis TaxID=3775 RepID=A0A1Q3B6R3_CEPFO|nr:GASA domain-containing protein [Cephalotus follicularis]
MAISKKLLIASILISLLVPYLVEADQVENANQEATYTSTESAKTINCSSACSARCRLASRTRMCLRACGTCCARCNCVPPGTSGNTDVCPCYATMTTHGGKLKCP